MRLLSYLYAFAIFGVFAAYWLLNINVIWLEGYLIVLFLINIVPKKIRFQIVFAVVVAVTAAVLSYYGQPSAAKILTAILILTAGIPGILTYAFMSFLFSNIPAVGQLVLIPETILLILVAVHAVKYIVDRVMIVTIFLPIFDLVPMVVDIILTLVMAYFVFTYSSTLYPVVQAGANYFAHNIL